jgi:Uma2 family endonuclease
MNAFVPTVGQEPRAEDYAPRVTWEEYLEMEDPPGFRLEYERGRLLVSPTGRAAHDFLRDILAMDLGRYEEENPQACSVISEHSFFMPPGERDYRPDVAVVVDERKDKPIDPMSWGEGAPDIVIEVLSPSTEDRDLGLKAKRYFDQGSDEYWLFDPLLRSARFCRRGQRGWEISHEGQAGSYATAMLPGFVIDLPKLWQRLDRKLRRDTGGKH